MPVADRSTDTILDALRRNAVTMPHALAFAIDDGGRATWGQLLAEVGSTASGLSRLGVRAGQVCGLQLRTGIDLIRLLFALQWLGAIPVILSPTLSRDTLRRRLVPLGCRRVFVAASPATSDGRHREESFELVPVDGPGSAANPAPPPHCAPGDIAYLQLTSGTTGEPKAAAITHRNLMFQLQALFERHRIDRRDVLVSWMPLHHDFGLVQFVFAPVFFGRPVHLLQPSLANIRSWLATVSRVRGTLTASPDFGYRLATRAVDPSTVDLSCLRLAINGGEPVRRSTVEDFESRFGVSDVVRPGYGLGEATLGVTSLPIGAPHRTDRSGNVSCGPPLSGIEVRITDEDGRDTEGTGQIQVRGDTVFAGYWQDPDATRQVLRDGWLATGDVGSLDADGHLYVSGRRRAMIKRAGALIPARAVEEIVDGVEGVRRSAAIAGYDAAGSEDVVVIAEAEPGVLKSADRRRRLQRAIEADVRQALGFPPAEIVLTRPKSIPLSQNGKLQHLELRERYLSGALTAVSD